MSKLNKIEGAQFVRYFGPLLDALRGLGGSGTPDEVVERIAEDLKIPDEVQNELLPSGESRYRNQVAWARFYLVREGLVDSSKRGVWSLTERGRSTTLTLEQARQIFLKWVKIFQEQRRAKADKAEPTEEVVAEGTGATSTDYRNAVLDLLLKLPATGFERLCQRLLREAGFTQVVVTGSTGDGGIDGYGTLSVNPLHLSALISKALAEPSLNLSRNAKKALPGLRDLGHMSAHGRYFTAQKGDVDAAQVGCRVVVEEFLHHAGLL